MITLLVFRFAKFDVTEAQMVIIGMLLTTSIVGPGLWTIGMLKKKFKHDHIILK